MKRFLVGVLGFISATLLGHLIGFAVFWFLSADGGIHDNPLGIVVAGVQAYVAIFLLHMIIREFADGRLAVFVTLCGAIFFSLMILIAAVNEMLTNETVASWYMLSIFVYALPWLYFAKQRKLLA